MSAPGRSLRSTVSWTTVVLAGFALVAAMTVVGLMTLLHQATLAIEASTHSVRVAEEAQVDLLLHSEAKSLIVRRDLAGSIQRRLSEAEDYVASDSERLVLDQAKARALEYVLASREPGRQDDEIAELRAAAFSAIEDLVVLNVAQAREESKDAARVDYLANIGVVAFALLVVGVAAFILYWVRGPLMLPIWEIGHAMRRFGQGEHTSRAPIAGPLELREMAERFNEMAAQIERQRERQREFLAGVAHDLRNPVSVLLLSTEIARDDVSLPEGHPTRRALDRNARQLNKLDRMISDFLDTAAIEAGQLELRFEIRDLRNIVRSTAELFEETSAQHEVVLCLPQEPVQARVDPLRLEQVTTNLISNAIKYSPDGGKVEVRIQQGDELMIAVTDHGLGMSPEVKAHLFEPFRRGLSREGIPGMGLGLFVVRRIIAAHHGRIEIESSPGVGSTFRVFLPSLSAESVASKSFGQGSRDTRLPGPPAESGLVT